jgi:hypothetical protein
MNVNIEETVMSNQYKVIIMCGVESAVNIYRGFDGGGGGGSVFLFTPWPLDSCSWNQVLQLLEAKPLSQSGRFTEDKSILCLPGIE